MSKESLSELLKRRLKELGLRNIDFANLAGLSRSYIGNMINETAPTKSGQYNPEPETVAKIAKALQITESEILATLGYNTENAEPKDSYEVFEGVKIVFEDNQILSEQKKQEILNTVKIVARGVMSGETSIKATPQIMYATDKGKLDDDTKKKEKAG